MRSYSHLSEDERDQSGVFCGPRGGRWGPLPGRSVGRKLPSPGSCSERTPFGRVLAASRRRSLSIAAGGVKRSSNERPLLRLFVADRLAEGWTLRTDLRLVEIQERTAAAGHRL